MADNTSPDHPARAKDPEQPPAKDALPVTRQPFSYAVLVIALAATIALILIGHLVFVNVRLPTVATESQALTATADKLVQMAQWTIGVVLSLGGLFIGVNWYQAEDRYRRDRAEITAKMESAIDSVNTALAKVNKLESIYDERLRMVENVSIFLTDSISGQEILKDQDILSYPLSAAPSRFIELYRVEALPLRKRGLIWALGASLFREVSSGRVTAQTILEVSQFATELDAEDSVQANMLSQNVKDASLAFIHREVTRQNASD